MRNEAFFKRHGKKPLIFIILILLVKPTGLLGKRKREKV